MLKFIGFLLNLLAAALIIWLIINFAALVLPWRIISIIIAIALIGAGIGILRRAFR
jgi:hypothetical protein